MRRVLDRVVAPASLFALLVGVGPAMTFGSSEGDFRCASWGDSKEQVKQCETARLHHLSNDEIAFTDDSIEGIEGGIIYVFERDALVTGLYVSRREHPAGEGAWAAYLTLRAELERRLASSGEETRRWIGTEGGAQPPDLSPDRLVSAVAAGRLRLATEWVLDTTRAELIMTGTEDGGVFLRAVFKPSS